MKTVLVTGGSGFIGRGLVKDLLARGDRVTVLTRDVGRTQAALPGARVVSWSSDAPGAWFEEVDGVDAVVHLAGETIVKRWTEEARREIVRSRIDTTRLMGEAIGKAKRKPSTFLCASAVGYYGPQPGEKVLDEDAAPGEGFLADVVVRWEEAARAVEEQHGVRSVQLRIGVVIGEGGGALDKMIAPFRFFLGGPVGDGKQVISWIHRDDVVGMTLLALDNEAVRGPFNMTAPYAQTGDEVAQAIGAVLHRPSWLRVPEAVVKLGMGDAAEIITTGQRVYPRRAEELGYKFRYARIVPALESILRS
ncbi:MULTISPECIES: TIGR01777 family oxidoreductase [Sorangium]|uniref:TIGR01777 family oxidoreductase n=1 Tax=Sorangium atrum TaxID=2995308 RepID=A0ABT5BVR0_9BACT|nr:TIGR01777 family oxidoreductase [Sorangium aterium]MDC0678242.1 TIGR01777 family oxidoreductase [Sorangium aterium]